jgi:hypothetical protein
MKKVNERVIIASDQEMIDAGLIKCNPRENTITIWTYELNHVWNEMQWTPVMSVFTEPLTEDIKDEDGDIIERKSTHKIDDFYGAVSFGQYDFTRYLTSRGVSVEPLKK